MAIVAILREPILQGFHLLAQAGYLLALVLDHGVLLAEHRLLLLDEFVSQRQLFPQYLILFSQRKKFFFDRHALTLLGLTPFGKSPADLGSYQKITSALPSSQRQSTETRKELICAIIVVICCLLRYRYS